MLLWLLDVLAVVNTVRRWAADIGWSPGLAGEPWVATELDCLSSTTVLVWVSRHVPHEWLLGVWIWGVIAGVAACLGAFLGLALVLWRQYQAWGPRLRFCPSVPPTPVSGDAEWRLAITREVQLALEGLEQSRRTPVSPRQMTSGWLPPATPRAPVTRTITPVEASIVPLQGENAPEGTPAAARVVGGRRRARSARHAS